MTTLLSDIQEFILRDVNRSSEDDFQVEDVLRLKSIMKYGVAYVRDAIDVLMDTEDFPDFAESLGPSANFLRLGSDSSLVPLELREIYTAALRSLVASRFLRHEPCRSIMESDLQLALMTVFLEGRDAVESLRTLDIYGIMARHQDVIEWG